MGNEYNGRKVILRDTNGNQMSLPRFFQLALVGPNGEGTYPTQGYPNHNAWDIGCNGLTGVIPARCPVAGEVTLAQTSSSAGNWVIVREDTNGSFDRWHIFMHLDSFSVSVGDLVYQGTEVGKIGNTGKSSGSHLHYQVAIENPQDVSRVSENPIDVFDESTLPSGWNMEDASTARDWDYIQLDNSATDYGPPDAVTVTEPFSTDTICHDISHPQSNNINLCIDCIVAAGHGGIIFGGGKIENSGFVDWTHKYPNYHADQAMLYAKGKIPMGVYFYNYADFGNDTKQAVKDALLYLQNAGLGPSDFKLGIWLDIDSEGGGGAGDPYLDPNPEVNMVNVRDFIETCLAAGYGTAGIYTTAGVLISSKFMCDYIYNSPIWCAAIGSGHLTFDDSSLAWLIRNYPNLRNYKYIYMHQYSWVEHVSGWVDDSGKLQDLDGDKVLKAIPTVAGGGSSTSPTQSSGTITIDVDVIPPKRIYFSPNPGLIDGGSNLINRTQTISITTDAEDADIYFTANGATPYVYIKTEGGIRYQLSKDAIKYENPLEIHADTHLRVLAIPKDTIDTFPEILAKGSGTFLFRQEVSLYSWDDEKISYSLQSSDKRINYFEENKQAFLRFHPEETDEEVLYNAVFASTQESKAEEQSSGGNESGGVD